MGNSTYKSWRSITIVAVAFFIAPPCAFAQAPEKESAPPAKSDPKKIAPAKVDPKKAKTAKGSSKKAAKKPIKPKKVTAKPLTKEEKEIIENLELLLLLELLNDYTLFDEEPK